MSTAYLNEQNEKRDYEERIAELEAALRASHAALTIARSRVRGFAPENGPPVVSVVDDALALIVKAMPNARP